MSAGHSRKPGIDAEKLSFYCWVCFNNFHSRSKFSFKTNICFIKVYFCFRMLKAFSLLSHSKPKTEGKQIKLNICWAESAGNTETSNIELDMRSETYLVNSSLGRKFHSFLFLSLVAEPDPNHVFLQIEFLRDGCYFLSTRPGLDCEVSFKRALLWGCYGGPFSVKSVNHRVIWVFIMRR